MNSAKVKACQVLLGGLLSASELSGAIQGTVTAWEENGYGQSSVPTNLCGIVATAAGTHHSLALKGGGTVVAWGQM